MTNKFFNFGTAYANIKVKYEKNISVVVGKKKNINVVGFWLVAKKMKCTSEEADAEADAAAGANAEGRTQLAKIAGLHHRKLP